MVKSILRGIGVVALGTFALMTLLSGIACLFVSGDAMGAGVCLMAMVGCATLTDALLDR